MRYLTLDEALAVYDRVMRISGGGIGILDMGALKSALAQPRMTFGGEDLYTSLTQKAAALGFSLIQNHPFVDGNKRAGHAVMELFLILNGQEINASSDEQYDIILKVASGELTRDAFAAWLADHVQAFYHPKPQ